MVRVNMIVEGQTEEAFVNQVLAPYLSQRQIYPVARRVTTSRQKRVRGGMTTYIRVKADIENWLKQDGLAYCTTIFDLYGLPSDFPGYEASRAIMDPYERVRQLEGSLLADLGDHRFIPNLLLHEYEALLYSDPDKLDEIVGLMEVGSQIHHLEQILATCGGPEKVNDNPETAPSKRLIQLYPGYDKVLFGVWVAESIGIDTIREKCPHFDEWISKLESLKPLSPSS